MSDWEQMHWFPQPSSYFILNDAVQTPVPPINKVDFAPIDSISGENLAPRH